VTQYNIEFTDYLNSINGDILFSNISRIFKDRYGNKVPNLDGFKQNEEYYLSLKIKKMLIPYNGYNSELQGVVQEEDVTVKVVNVTVQNKRIIVKQLKMQNKNILEISEKQDCVMLYFDVEEEVKMVDIDHMSNSQSKAKAKAEDDNAIRD